MGQRVEVGQLIRATGEDRVLRVTGTIDQEHRDSGAVGFDFMADYVNNGVGGNRAFLYTEDKYEVLNSGV